jgi:putative two-component system response regulator
MPGEVDGRPSPRYTGGVKKVVVVDDDDEMRGLMCLLLENRYEVSSAVNGAQALEVVRKVRPDLLVLDLLMPVMHGFEVCQRLRADPELKSTKILISSSKSYQHDVRTAIEETGADDYIVKPFAVDEFNRRVDAMVKDAQA